MHKVKLHEMLLNKKNLQNDLSKLGCHGNIASHDQAGPGLYEEALILRWSKIARSGYSFRRASDLGPSENQVRDKGTAVHLPVSAISSSFFGSTSQESSISGTISFAERRR